MAKRANKCAYCGSTKNLTRDHVPPRALFVHPRPGNLITVPSCVRCNQALSKDDEYFRHMLCLNERMRNHPDAESHLDAIRRSWQNPSKTGFLRALLSGTGQVRLFSPSGLYLGRKSYYTVDLSRIESVIKRVVKGLFYHHRKSPLPSRYDVRVIMDDMMARYRNDPIFVRTLNALIGDAPRTFGRNVFSYRVAFTPEDPCISAWLLQFYGAFIFLGMTGKANWSSSAVL